MSASKLPERPSLAYLRKLAKDRLENLRQSDPQAKLAAAYSTSPANTATQAGAR